jgi:1-acyl-sn-glycerol-3-phosphate acyltransferase
VNVNAVMATRPVWLRASVRGVLFLFANLVLVPLYAAAAGPLRRWRRPLQVLWCRATRAICGIEVHTFGEACRGGPILFVANHVSYLDIPVISETITGCFVAKAEVARWPLFGIIAKVTRTVFVDRVGTAAREQRQELLSRLLNGENLILFPEGTSTDGAGVAPFKSALFGIAENLPAGLGLTIQPLSVAYVRDADGAPLSGARRALYCWFGEATMAPHLWRVLGLKGCHAELRFHPPVAVPANADRKVLSAQCRTLIAAGVALSNAGMTGTGLPAATAGAAAPLSAAGRAVAGGARRSGPTGH